MTHALYKLYERTMTDTYGVVKCLVLVFICTRLFVGWPEVPVLTLAGINVPSVL